MDLVTFLLATQFPFHLTPSLCPVAILGALLFYTSPIIGLHVYSLTSVNIWAKTLTWPFNLPWFLLIVLLGNAAFQKMEMKHNLDIMDVMPTILLKTDLFHHKNSESEDFKEY